MPFSSVEEWRQPSAIVREFVLSRVASRCSPRSSFIHILYVNKTLPTLGGGAETRIWEVGQRLVKRGHRVSVVCAATEPNLPHRETLNGIDIHYLRTVPEFLLRNTRLFHNIRLGFYAPKLAFYVRCGPAIEQIALAGLDIIRDDIGPFPAIPAVRVGRRQHIPLVATVHNLCRTWRRWREFYGTALGTAGYLGEYWFRRRTPYDFVISDSEWMRQALEGHWPADRLIWIPNGVDPALFYPGSIKEAETDRALNLFYVGRFILHKGHRVLIDALAQVLQTGLRAKLHLTGQGPLLRAVQSQVEALSLEAHVIFHGQVQKEAMPELYRQMDIFVSPSFFEGLPVSILEAMASGLPIISTRIEAAEGILDDENALLVAPGDPQALTRAILRLAEDPEARQRMGAWGRREIETKYTWDIIADRELAVYESVMNGQKKCSQREEFNLLWRNQREDQSGYGDS